MSSEGMSSTSPVAVRRLPLIHVFGMMLAIGSVLGWWLTVNSGYVGPLYFFGFLLMFLASTLFPALLVKAISDRRPLVALYVIPVLAMLTWALVRFVGMVVS